MHLNSFGSLNASEVPHACRHVMSCHGLSLTWSSAAALVRDSGRVSAAPQPGPALLPTATIGALRVTDHDSDSATSGGAAGAPILPGLLPVPPVTLPDEAASSRSSKDAWAGGDSHHGSSESCSQPAS